MYVLSARACVSESEREGETKLIAVRFIGDLAAILVLVRFSESGIQSP